MNIINKKVDFHLLKFPIIFPIIYCGFLYGFPEYEKLLIYFTILFLAETHFGATWPFFLDKVNKEYIFENKINLIIFPLIILFLSVGGFFLYKATFILIFYAVNIYHVTRQSFGIAKLFIKNKLELRFSELTIYFFNFSFFIIGFLRFYTNSVNKDDLLILNMIVLSLMSFLALISIIKYKFSENTLIMIAGWIIFYPSCFVDKPIHIILMGVTMHFTQYLVLTYKVTQKRMLDKIAKKKTKNNFLNKIKKYFIIILLYSLTMTFFSSLGSSGKIIIQNLILIPMLGQMIHFYIDSQLWKFSETHNRNNVLKHLLN